jgi:hypothetical protein
MVLVWEIEKSSAGATIHAKFQEAGDWPLASCDSEKSQWLQVEIWNVPVACAGDSESRWLEVAVLNFGPLFILSRYVLI